MKETLLRITNTKSEKTTSNILEKWEACAYCICNSEVTKEKVTSQAKKMEWEKQSYRRYLSIENEKRKQKRWDTLNKFASKSAWELHKNRQAISFTDKVYKTLNWEEDIS